MPTADWASGMEKRKKKGESGILNEIMSEQWREEVKWIE